MLKLGPSNKLDPDIQGLILIDCWEAKTKYPEHDIFYQNLVQQVAKFDIKHIVSACYTEEKNKSALLSYYLYKNLTKMGPIVDILNLDDFVEYCQLHSSIDWFVVGMSWQICVHTRNMGLNKFSEIEHINFYADHWSFLKEDGTTTTRRDFQQDALLWGEVPKIGYHLISNHNYYT